MPWSPHQGDPRSPPYQRKLEGVVRVLSSAWNSHPDHHNAIFTVLWKSLTIMMPQAALEHDPYHQVAAKVECPTAPLGNITCQITGNQAMLEKLQHKETGEEENLWEKAWNSQWWGRQMEEDDLDKAAAEKVETTPPKGKGKGSKSRVGQHWTKGFTTTSYENPIPLDVNFVWTTEAIEYDVNEYNVKMGRADLNTSQATSSGAAPSSPDPKGAGKGAKATTQPTR